MQFIRWESSIFQLLPFQFQVQTPCEDSADSTDSTDSAGSVDSADLADFSDSADFADPANFAAKKLLVTVSLDHPVKYLQKNIPICAPQW